MSLTDAWQIADKYTKEATASGRNKVSGFAYMLWQIGSGYDATSLANLPMRDVSAEHFIKVKTNLTTEYKNRILK